MNLITNIIPKLWEFFLEKKKETNAIIQKNIDKVKHIIFSNQTAQLQFFTMMKDTNWLLQMDTLFRQHGYLIARILESIGEDELINIKYDDFPDISQETDEELDNRTEFKENLLALIVDEMRLLFLIA